MYKYLLVLSLFIGIHEASAETIFTGQQVELVIRRSPVALSVPMPDGQSRASMAAAIRTSAEIQVYDTPTFETIRRLFPGLTAIPVQVVLVEPSGAKSLSPVVEECMKTLMHANSRPTSYVSMTLYSANAYYNANARLMQIRAPAGKVFQCFIR